MTVMLLLCSFQKFILRKHTLSKSVVLLQYHQSRGGWGVAWIIDQTTVAAGHRPVVWWRVESQNQPTCNQKWDQVNLRCICLIATNISKCVRWDTNKCWEKIENMMTPVEASTPVRPFSFQVWCLTITFKLLLSGSFWQPAVYLRIRMLIAMLVATSAQTNRNCAPQILFPACGEPTTAFHFVATTK